MMFVCRFPVRSDHESFASVKHFFFVDTLLQRLMAFGRKRSLAKVCVFTVLQLTMLCIGFIVAVFKTIFLNTISVSNFNQFIFIIYFYKHSIQVKLQVLSR